MAEAPASKAKSPPGTKPAPLGGGSSGRGPGPSPSGGRLPQESRRRLYGQKSDGSSARSRSSRRRRRSPGRARRPAGQESPHRLELTRDTYETLVEASRHADTEAAHTDLIGQFLAATRSGRYIKNAVVSSIADRIRKWGITIHDFRGFSENDLQVFMDGDKPSENGITLAKPGSGRLSVIEAFRAAREFDAMPPRRGPPRRSRTL